jgi:hypothetical protein
MDYDEELDDFDGGENYDDDGAGAEGTSFLPSRPSSRPQILTL